MEMQTGPVTPEARSLAVDEDALVSQVLEIIGGIAADALNTLAEPEDGDDSVFFSDEDQDQRDVKDEAPCSSGEEQPVDGVEESEAVELQPLVHGVEENLQDLRMPGAELIDGSEAAEQELQCDRSSESIVQEEAELKSSAAPGERKSIPVVHQWFLLTPH